MINLLDSFWNIEAEAPIYIGIAVAILVVLALARLIATRFNAWWWRLGDRLPPIGPVLLLGGFAAFWLLTGSLLAAIALFAACFVGAYFYGRGMGHSR